MTRPDIERLIARVESGLAFGELKPYAEALRWCLGEIDAMRPVVDAAVRVVELDEICEAHPGINDEIGQRAEQELYTAVAARTAAVDAYRASKP